MPSETVEIRPRTTGELLDDAWRLALADYPWLGLLSGLFLVPFFCVALLLLTRPAPEGWAAKPLLPALAALLLPLTGLGSGACQELFRLRAEGKPVGPAPCLGGALRRGLEHAAIRSVTGAMAVTCGALLLALGAQEAPGLTGLLLLGLLAAAAVSLPLWVVLAPLHAVLATGRGRPGAGWGQVGREAFFAPGKAAAVTLGRLPLLLLTCVNLGLLVAAGLWVAGNLAGLDVAYLKVQLSAGDPVYTTALVLLAWLLLAPFFEASNFLLHLDTRTRQEGLDLRFRVERVFAVAGRKSAAVLLAVGLGLFAGPGRLSAADAPLDVVRSVRAGVERVRDEVKAAEPWPGAQRWAPQLQDLGRRLERSGAGGARGVRWYRESIEGFGERNRADAQRVLNQLQRRLSLLEEALALAPREPGAGRAGGPRLSPEEVKDLLRRQATAPERKRPAPEEKVKEDEGPKQPEVRHEDGDGGGGGRPRPASGAIAPVAGGGFGAVAWMMLAGVVVAILAVALALFFSSRRSAPAAPAPRKEAPHTTPEEIGPQLYEQPASVLWKQAEGLAREGRFLEAVRLLYLAVLSTLHQRRLVQCEPTRTNGEYVLQVRLTPEAPPGLHAPFEELTALFELKWYGERACEAADFAACRRLAEDVRARVGKG
jgi:hypothetical protein